MNYKANIHIYQQLNFEERANIAFLLNNLRLSFREIARKLNRDVSTISREVKRNSINGKYFADKANLKYLKRFKTKFIDIKDKYLNFMKYFRKYFDKKWHGVEATWHRILAEMPNIKAPSLRQLFNIINSGKWIVGRKDRLRRKYRKGGKRSAGYFSKFNTKYIIPIWARPNKINDRLEFGHWEIDLVLGKKTVWP